ncbi:BPSL0761 family protein [Paraburkholderia aspalathi]|uniref:BPSL0761 family protein n=1 Tax=Paraburkholderia aspalathi TaxID=1324617 RepID=UPI0038BCD32E
MIWRLVLHAARENCAAEVSEENELTTAEERTRALLRAHDLIVELSLAESTTQLETLRDKAIAVLRHYPDRGEIELIAKGGCWLEWPR